MPISAYIRSLRERIGQDLLLLPAVSAVIVDDDGRILLARSHGDDQWALIGGGIEPGEEPSASIAREVREELGVEATVGQIVGVYGGDAMFITYANGDRCAYVTTAYACRLAPGPLVLEESELRDVGWFEPSEISKLDTQPYVERILVDAGVPI
ncbi:NUDIX domain-containing protein [Microbacterium murale]|uniref:Phosphohydrolase n=1 Tax=Microbacterium murale TaxID=1081040 RepID=A0ABQ1RRB9_9MICO|nr:NUDIX domain-containing protein [Microbacterium murale]GGD78843.1 phosphohydrolase [Microbacterium murale]